MLAPSRSGRGGEAMKWITLVVLLTALGCSGTPEEEYRQCLREAAGRQGESNLAMEAVTTARTLCGESTGFMPVGLIHALMAPVNLEPWFLETRRSLLRRGVDEQFINKIFGCPEPEPGS